MSSHNGEAELLLTVLRLPVLTWPYGNLVDVTDDVAAETAVSKGGEARVAAASRTCYHWTRVCYMSPYNVPSR